MYTITKHATQRFSERHGVVMNDKMAWFLIKDIRDGRADQVAEGEEGITQWVVSFNGNRYRVAYDQYRKLIVTVYPRLTLHTTKHKKKRTKKKVGDHKASQRECGSKHREAYRKKSSYRKDRMEKYS